MNYIISSEWSGVATRKQRLHCYIKLSMSRKYFNGFKCLTLMLFILPQTRSLDPSTASLPLEDQILYHEAVGSLIYLMVWTRRDLAFAVRVVARFMHAPTNHPLENAQANLSLYQGYCTNGVAVWRGVYGNIWLHSCLVIMKVSTIRASMDCQVSCSNSRLCKVENQLNFNLLWYYADDF